MHTNILLRQGFAGHAVLKKIVKIPVLREVIGAAAGGAMALLLYEVFEFGRDLLGDGVLGAVGSRMHGAASLVMAQGVAGLSISASVALAAACTYMHCLYRKVSA